MAHSHGSVGPAKRGPAGQKPQERLDRVAIRFAGDSGDGVQLTGTKFTESTALAGNDLSTLPDFPAEIRAPAGTLAGVSGYQIHFSSEDVRTPADQADVLVAFNPAALRACLADVRRSGTVIVNIDAFTEKTYERAGYSGDPLPAVRERYRLIEIPMTRLTLKALEDLSLSQREAGRSKNFFALGLMYWLYGRPHRGDREVDRVALRGRDPRGEPPRADGRLPLRRDQRDCSRCRSRCRAPRSSPASTGTSPATARSRSAASQRA